MKKVTKKSVNKEVSKQEVTKKVVKKQSKKAVRDFNSLISIVNTGSIFLAIYDNYYFLCNSSSLEGVFDKVVSLLRRFPTVDDFDNHLSHSNYYISERELEKRLVEIERDKELYGEFVVNIVEYALS